MLGVPLDPNHEIVAGNAMKTVARRLRRPNPPQPQRSQSQRSLALLLRIYIYIYECIIYIYIIIYVYMYYIYILLKPCAIIPECCPFERAAAIITCVAILFGCIRCIEMF